MMMQCLLLLLLLHLVSSALPPGSEDEVYCPAGWCLRPKHPRPRGTGSRLRFLECVNEINSSETCRPRGWGDKLELKYKQDLINLGWHTRECNTLPTLNTLMRFQLLDSRLDAIVLQFI